jgi:hypothetical protein
LEFRAQHCGFLQYPLSFRNTLSLGINPAVRRAIKDKQTVRKRSMSFT